MHQCPVKRFLEVWHKSCTKRRMAQPYRWTHNLLSFFQIVSMGVIERDWPLVCRLVVSQIKMVHPFLDMENNYFLLQIQTWTTVQTSIINAIPEAKRNPTPMTYFQKAGAVRFWCHFCLACLARPTHCRRIFFQFLGMNPPSPLLLIAMVFIC